MVALLIDCWMIAVSLAALARTGGLPPEEQRLVDAHAQLVAELIRQCFPEIAPLAADVGSHPKRADGRGQPSELQGTSIPGLARLLAVADVCAGLNETRPHRPAEDGRAALTKVLLLTEHGLLDRNAAGILVRLSFYPVGAVVKLTDGWVGVVVANHPNPSDPRTPGRPVVAVLTNPDETLLPHPEHIDLSTADRGGILRALAPERRRKLFGVGSRLRCAAKIIIGERKRAWEYGWHSPNHYAHTLEYAQTPSPIDTGLSPSPASPITRQHF